jgi:hypothetical protein
MRRFALLSALAVVLAVPLQAEEPNLSLQPSGSNGAAARYLLAQETYALAMAKGDAILLVASIRLARSVTLRPQASWEKTTSGEAIGEPPAERVDLPDPSGPEAIAIAQALAAEDPVLQDLVYDIDAQLPKDATATAAEAVANLGAGQSDTWRLPLFGEVPAEIALIGGEKSALAMTVLDDTGQSICAAPSGFDPVLCRFTPARNGFFLVVIQNTGDAWTSYRLVGN